MLRKTDVFKKWLAARLSITPKHFALIMVVLAICAGCQSHEQNKKAAEQRWDQASARIKLSLAQQQYDGANYDQAVVTVRQCISADPQMAPAHLLLGKLLLTQGNTAGAVAELRLAVELDQNLHECWYWLGVAAQEQRDYRQAAEYYHKAMSLQPANIDYILASAEAEVALNNFAEAATLLTEKIAALPRDVSLKVAAADLMLRMGRNETAIELYRKAVLLTNENLDITEALGYCYVFSGQWNEAAGIFNTLIERCEDEKKKKVYLEAAALCSMNCAQYDKAVNYYNKLSVEERNNAEIWLKMGRAALGAGIVPRALMCGRKALALRPGYADALALIGCAQYADGDYGSAAESFKKISSDKKNSAFSWLMIARCYEQLGRTDESDQAYEKARQMNPAGELADFLAKDRNI
jgi:tetratricopeptide (TPR) repeat protein